MHSDLRLRKANSITNSIKQTCSYRTNPCNELRDPCVGVSFWAPKPIRVQDFLRPLPTLPNLWDFGRYGKTAKRSCTQIILGNRWNGSFSEMLVCHLNVQMQKKLPVLDNFEQFYHQVTLTLSKWRRNHACLYFVRFLLPRCWMFSLACNETLSKHQPICTK